MIVNALIAVGLSLAGSATYIVWILKKESDKFEKTKKDFPEKNFIKKNKWDFIFYISSGLIALAMKSLISHFVGIDGMTDMSLSALSGLLGSVVIGKLLNKSK